MIEATNKMTDSDKQMVSDFNNQIINEYGRYLKTIENYTKLEIILKAKKIAFMQCMRDYLVDDASLSLRQIYELSHEYNLLHRCLDVYEKNCDNFGFYEFGAMEIIRLVMQDDDF